MKILSYAVKNATSKENVLEIIKDRPLEQLQEIVEDLGLAVFDNEPKPYVKAILNWYEVTRNRKPTTRQITVPINITIPIHINVPIDEEH